MAQLGPYKPDEEERTGYYFGIAGPPKLIARTSHERWVRPKSGAPPFSPVRKIYAAISSTRQADLDLVAKWTDELVRYLVQALEECDFSFFFPIRTGLDDRVCRDCDFSTVLMVGVRKDSLEWERGIDIAVDCRNILRNAGITTVEVEIREGEYEHYAASWQLEQEIEPVSWLQWLSRSGRTNELTLPLLSNVGYPVSCLDGSDCETTGTIGLHLTLGDDKSTFFGLTCRHVVSRKRQVDEAYVVSDGHREPLIQAGKRDFESCCLELETRQKVLEATIQGLGEWQQVCEAASQHNDAANSCFSVSPEKFQEDLGDAKAALSYHERIMECVRKLSNEEDRRIRHLACHPKLEWSRERPGLLRDWALIQMDRDKFPNGVLENKVYTDDGHYGEFPHYYYLPCFLKLFLDSQDADTDGKGAQPFRVVKRGPRTGFTVGCNSSIHAVVRPHANLQPGEITKHMLIIPAKKQSVFAVKGESGAAVLSDTGEVVGMINGGIAQPEEAGSRRCAEVDVTFATPIWWILNDVAEFTGMEPRLA